MEAALEALETVSLPERPQSFVDQTRARYKQYGQDMFFSVKQWGFLRSLYEENVGSWDAI